jgi:hypothetical protein
MATLKMARAPPEGGDVGCVPATAAIASDGCRSERDNGGEANAANGTTRAETGRSRREGGT